MAGQTEQNGANIRIYIVEDHEGFRDLLVTFVGFQRDIECCGTAASGEEALDNLERAQPDVVVSDLVLPNMSGIDLAREIRRRLPQTRILILSGHKEHHYVRLARNVGANGYIVKGTPKEFLDAVRRCHQGEFVVSPDL